MGAINYDLKKIKAFVFDIDGVLSPDSIPLSPEGEPMRMFNIKDCYTIRGAIKCGYRVAVITGGKSEAVRSRLSVLGVKDIYMGSSNKIKDLIHYLEKAGIDRDEVLYSGDDIPDYQAMEYVGLAVAPADAAPEIKNIAQYISDKKGGEGVVRDVIEQVMKVQGYWMREDAHNW